MSHSVLNQCPCASALSSVTLTMGRETAERMVRRFIGAVARPSRTALSLNSGFKFLSAPTSKCSRNMFAC